MLLGTVGGLGLATAGGLGLATSRFVQAQVDAARDGSAARGMINDAAREDIRRGLNYLVRQQHQDGSFGAGRHRGNVAITSLAGLALMANGSQPGRGPYGREVADALQYVIGQERQRHQNRAAPGFLYNPTRIQHGPMYGHGFGTLFLAEAYGMVPDRNLASRLRATLGRATQLIINSQNRDGGWRYRPFPSDADISVTICQIMALRAARNAGFYVPRNVVDNCINYVKDCQSRDGGFRYQKRRGTQTGFARTAAGLVALYSAGLYEDETITRALNFLHDHCRPTIRNRPRHLNMDINLHFYYGHYYAAQAMWIAGGHWWRTWFPEIRDDLHRRRRDDGSWYDGRIDPHYCTAMALIVLQVPNNYLPIFQR